MLFDTPLFFLVLYNIHCWIRNGERWTSNISDVVGLSKAILGILELYDWKPLRALMIAKWFYRGKSELKIWSSNMCCCSIPGHFRAFTAGSHWGPWWSLNNSSPGKANCRAEPVIYLMFLDTRDFLGSFSEHHCRKPLRALMIAT